MHQPPKKLQKATPSYTLLGSVHHSDLRIPPPGLFGHDAPKRIE
eukprot:CAMPEP_0178460036 /NCGR_PEP_ID=MMETSP0689_2-20121128/48463_1 /TAXON_ID=160604 /ORGANISM="Amphidinium massartii, Strain CS-259" /LENGTH=43 /DNA_ID= /DNA_START= /DNA_END= /DNA_ORIENTATION=